MYIKNFLPKPLIQILKKWRLQNHRRAFMANLDRAVASLREVNVAKPARSLLIFPSDPLDIVGAVGDDAMISATIEHFRQDYSDLRITVLCLPGAAEQIVRSRGWEPVPIPDLGDFPRAMANLFATGKYDALVMLGADVMDGYYNPDFTKQLLVAADLAAKSGLRSIILGFSFNATPDPTLEPFFASLDKRVSLNARDAISLERLTRFAQCQARLVADSAFTLRPGQIDQETESWIRNEREAGRRVIGINLHPMLIRNADAEQIQRMVRLMADIVRAVDACGPLSWLLIPHDYRDAIGHGDGVCLRPLMSKLSALQGIHCRYFDGMHRASTLKALTGHLDGVVTGRMHLAIAALGMGVPVLCLTYQDKFEGLFRHFGLPSEFLLAPVVLENEVTLRDKLTYFIECLPKLTQQVQLKTPQVLELAESNFKGTSE